MSKKGGSSGNQTVTQQNIPDWAINYAQDTLNMGNAYTMNPDYRPSTLDRDYSGVRGYNAQGQPNSQVGQFGLNPSPAQPGRSNANDRRPIPPSSGPPNLDNLVSVLPPDMQTGGPFLRRPVQNMGPDSFRTGLIENPNSPGFVDDRPNGRRRGMVRVDTTDPAGTEGTTEETTQLPKNSVAAPPPTGSPVIVGYGRDYDPTKIYTDLELNALATSPTGEYDGDVYKKLVSSQNALKKAKQQAASQGGDGTGDGEEEEAVPFGDMLTPFQAYDRQRFAAPSDRTTQGENLLANRVNAGNPFAEAQAAARGASNYQSQFTPAALNLQGPTANTYNNVNQGLLANQYGNANRGLTPAQNYSRDFQQNLAQFQDPYTSQVVDQTIKDLDRARRITNNDISGSAAKSGAFGGSREALMRTENNRNFADRTAAAVGQLRSQGFQRAADRAQQEQLQRLGLTASDIQNLRGYQSAGNLQGQNISAQDVRDVRGLRSQGALTAQGLGAQSDRDVMNYQQQLQRQGNQLGVEQARLAEQFRQGAGALNLQGAGALGNLAQMQTADERQRIADLLASGGAQDARNQQDLDFIYGEFNRELDYPGRQIDLRNAAISPATGSIVTTTQPRYQQNPILGGAGAALAAYGMTKNPWIAGGAGLLSLLS